MLLNMNMPQIPPFDWSSMSAWLGITSLTALIAFIANIRKALSMIRSCLTWMRRKLASGLPKETLRLVPRPDQSWWHMGSYNNSPAMQVVCDWYITNITNGAVKVCGVKVRKPCIDGHVFVRHPKQNVYGDYYIAPQATTEGRADFWIQPPIKQVGEPVILDLEFIDQFGNIHRVKKVYFRPPQPKAKESEPILESVALIKDSVEKELVAILQNEIFRYKECGRRVGGLGSVVLNYQGRVVPGVGTDARSADSPEQQAIVPDPHDVIIESDNGDILVGYFNTLNETDKQSFVASLLDRVSRDTAYANIGYFFLYVGFRIGILERVLGVAKERLKGDPKYGFSDLLRFLDGMLRYEHPNFSPSHLDYIEKFIFDLKDEHLYRIHERIQAIRARVLARKVGIS